VRILHITPAYYPATYWGGPMFSVLSLNNALAAMPDVELKVLTTDSAGPKVSQRVDIETVNPAWYPGQDVFFARRIAGNSISLDLLAKLVPLIRWADVVHLTATYSFPSIPTLIACRWLDTPLVWSPRGAILDDDAWQCLKRRRLKDIWLGLCNSLIKKGRVSLHVTSEDEKTASVARLPKANATIVRNGVDVPTALSPRTWLKGGTLRLLFIGRLAPKKGLENLLNAMKVLESDLDIQLTICGTGEKDYERSLKAKAGHLLLLDKSVHFVGHVDGERKREAFINSDVCVIPSFSENFCMVVAESLAHGTPVIASHGTPWSQIEDRQCGMWVANDPRTLVQSILAIRKENLDKMGERGWKWMRDEFSWDVIANDMYRVYREMSCGDVYDGNN